MGLPKIVRAQIIAPFLGTSVESIASFGEDGMEQDFGKLGNGRYSIDRPICSPIWKMLEGIGSPKASVRFDGDAATADNDQGSESTSKEAFRMKDFSETPTDGTEQKTDPSPSDSEAVDQLQNPHGNVLDTLADITYTVLREAEKKFRTE